MSTYRKKLIEVSLPLEAINVASAREKSIRHGHPSTLHLWWARRPLAAARAVLFAQLVDDPSSWPELFPTEEAQNHERQRLFRLIEELVVWENSNNERVINAARLEIAVSHARSSSSPKAKNILAESVKPEVVNEYLATELPPVHDPFAGGGTIPLEAQRLGLRAIASDLNPVAVMLNKALIEVPPKFAGRPPVSAGGGQPPSLGGWHGAEGLAEDVRHYSAWMRLEAMKLIGNLYADVDLPDSAGGGKASVVAWLWARTVASPDPSFKGCHVPLASTFLLSVKGGKKTWVRPVVEGRGYHFEIRTGAPIETDHVEMGTKLARGANFRCILSGSPIEPAYIKEEAAAGRLGARLMTVVAQAKRGRIFLAPTAAMERAASFAKVGSRPEEEMPKNPRWFSPPDYGMTRFGQLFTDRQLQAMEVYESLLVTARDRVVEDARRAGMPETPARLSEGGSGAVAYGDAVTLYLGLGLSKLADSQSSLVRWMPERDRVITTFSRQALPMIWDFAESNLFAEGSGDYASAVYNMMRVLPGLPSQGAAPSYARQRAAQDASDLHDVIVATDPPYFDNVGYADLSDFFYIWLRRALRNIFPTEMSTVLVPKDAELVATPYRHGGKVGAERFFALGMNQALESMARSLQPDSVTTIYYAFKQAESDSGGSSSTGWEGFLEAILAAGFIVDGTWPVRTERSARSVSIDTNALASSIVLACRKRPDGAPSTTRGEFRRILRKELPDGLKKLQQGNIAPVDVGQASIGPGMAVFSRHRHVLEANGSPMTVRSALQLINEVLDEYLASGEGDFDADTRFAITWYELHGWDAGLFGDAENIAKARNVSVNGVVEAGICRSAAGKVRILKRHEMRPLDYDPATDERPTIWEFTQHMIRYLEDEGEEAAARLLKKLGAASDATRELAYRLYNTCERKKWAEDARSYNALILAWPELEKLASRMGDDAPVGTPKKAGAKGKATKGTTKQRELFEGTDE